LQLQRNILATCPRVTRFKIDWGDGEGSENVAPVNNTENESNQMAMEQSNDSRNMKEETNDAPGKMDAMHTSSIPNAPLLAGASMKDFKKPDIVCNGSSTVEAMQM
jgi:hypothetical protein